MNGVYLDDEIRTGELGCALADAMVALSPVEKPVVIGLSGELGAGKTTLVRALLRRLGVTGTVRSPTYTLIEPYRAQGIDVAHLDLYRLADADELEMLGLRDLLVPGQWLLVEWPGRGHGVLPAPDLTVELSVAGAGRRAALVAEGPTGRRLVDAVARAGAPVGS